MIRLEMNGKPFNPKDFTEQILKAAMEQAAAEMHEKVSSIRHPDTGEFPTVVVSGTGLDDMSMRIEGSPELLALVHERLGLETNSESACEVVTASTPPPVPKVFLSYAWEDRELAAQIAHTLQANGIDTWWAEWCISAGDSLRQKIEEGLGECTHFVVLLTPNSIVKPWVNLEIDAGLMRKLHGRVKFIPLRNQLAPERLSPLLRGILSPAVEDPDQDIDQLINDIYGVSKKPNLGKRPAIVEASTSAKTGFSAAASVVAKEFVLSSGAALKFDPWLQLDGLVTATGLTEEDVVDAIHELRGLVVDHHDGTFYPESELFAVFDKFWMPWVPGDDALTLAADMVNDPDFPEAPAEIARRYEWDARRLNPAMAYLVNRKLVNGGLGLGTAPWLVAWLTRTSATRRFVKSRQ